MQAEQPNILELAKQGNPKAIAALMNRSLGSQGITAKAFLKENCLSISLESDQAIDPQQLAPLVYKGIVSLGIKSIKTVKLYGRKRGSEIPDWQQIFTLDTYIEPVASQIVVQPKVTVLQTTYPAKLAQSIVSKSNYPAKLAQPAASKFNKITLIIICSVGATLSLFLATFGWWCFSTRSAQASTLTKAQGLINGIGAVETHSTLTTLQSDQKQLQDSQKKLQEAMALLDSAPKLPVFNLNTIQVEQGKIQTQLAGVEQSLQDIDKTIKLLEQLIAESQEIVDEFSAIDSKLDVGMNYADYGQHIRDLKAALDRFGRKPGVKELPVYKALEAAFTEYSFAHDIWKFYIEDDDSSHNFFPASSAIGTTLTVKYGVLTTNIVGRNYIYLNTAISTVWEQAGRKVKNAQSEVQKM